MKDFIVKLQTDPYCWLILSIFTIVGFALTTVGLIKDRLRKRLSYFTESYLIGQNCSFFKEYEVSYRGEKPNKITLTKYTIWNNRNKTIDSNDVSRKRNISISASNNARILDAKIICADEANDFTISLIDSHKVTIEFDYIAKHDGVVLVLLYTGNEEDLTFDYKLKNPAKKVNKHSTYATSGDVGLAFGCFLKLLATFMCLFEYKKSTLIGFAYEDYILPVISCIPFLCVFVIVLLSFYRVPKPLRNVSVF